MVALTVLLPEVTAVVVVVVVVVVVDDAWMMLCGNVIVLWADVVLDKVGGK